MSPPPPACYATVQQQESWECVDLPEDFWLKNDDFFFGWFAVGWDVAKSSKSSNEGVTQLWPCNELKQKNK